MRYFMKRSARGIGAVLGLCLALSAGPAGAAQPVTLTYTGYMAGLPVFTLTANVELPAGEGSGAATLIPGNGRYSLNADAATSGTKSRSRQATNEPITRSARASSGKRWRYARQASTIANAATAGSAI